MENTPDDNKLPDLVVNREPTKSLNAVTVPLDSVPRPVGSETTGKVHGELNGTTNTSQGHLGSSVTPVNTELQMASTDSVTPVNMEPPMDVTASVVHENIVPVQDTDVNETVTPTPVGHDTTMTDEEEAVEALLSLSNLPDMDDDGADSDDNANLMPIGGPSGSIDVNPVKVKLSEDDINQAIKQLPMESKLAAPQNSQVDTTENSGENDPQLTARAENSPPNSPTKGRLKVKNYGLKKSRQSKRSYRCQKCGCKKGSVHDLNEHH